MDFLKKNWLIFLIVLLALILRLWGVTYGLPGLFVGDEKSLVGGALKMIYEKTVFPVFRPGYVFRLLYYPVLIPWIYLTIFVPYIIFVYLTGNFASIEALRDNFIMDPSKFFLFARIINAFFSAASVYLIFLITKRIFSKRAGFMAALLYAVSWLPIHQGHFSKHWNIGMFFALLAMYFSFLILEDARRKNYILAGLGIGLACLSNYISAFYGAILVFIHFLFNKSSLRNKIFDKKLWLFILIALIMFGFAVLVYPQDFIRIAFGEDSTIVRDKTFFEFLNTSFTILKSLYYLATFVFILSLFGYSILFFKNRKLFLVLVFIPFCSFFLYYFLYHFEPRYVLLFLPILTIVAGFGLDKILKFFRIKSDLASGLICLVIIFLPLKNAIIFDKMLIQTDTRNLAKEWVLENIPAGSKIVINSWEFNLNKEKDCIVQQLYTDNMSLRSRDYVMMNKVFPNSYCVWQIDLIKQLPKNINEYEYYIVDSFTGREFAYLGEELIKKGKLIKRFEGSSFNPAEDIITMFVHQRLKEKILGPIIDIYQLTSEKSKQK